MTKIEVLLLGLINETDLNPYQITKALDIINVSHWYPIGNSTVYSTIKKLCKKEMIIGHIEKKGNMPQKTVYSITDKGKKEFQKHLVEYLSSTEIEIVKFSIACIFICHLSKEKVVELLSEKEMMLQNIILHLEKEKSIMLKIKEISSTSISMISNNIYIYNAQLRTTKEMIADISSKTTWNDFITQSFNIGG